MLPQSVTPFPIGCVWCAGTGNDQLNPALYSKEANAHIVPMCSYCHGTGRHPIPLSEFYSGLIGVYPAEEKP